MRASFIGIAMKPDAVRLPTAVTRRGSFRIRGGLDNGNPRDAFQRQPGTSADLQNRFLSPQV
jgi:hypothetical protein